MVLDEGPKYTTPCKTCLKRTDRAKVWDPAYMASNTCFNRTTLERLKHTAPHRHAKSASEGSSWKGQNVRPSPKSSVPVYCLLMHPDSCRIDLLWTRSNRCEKKLGLTRNKPQKPFRKKRPFCPSVYFENSVSFCLHGIKCIYYFVWKSMGQ